MSEVVSAQWQRVSMKYALVDLIINLLLIALVGGVLAATLALQMFVLPLPVLIGLWALLAVLVVLSLLSFRRTRAIGYVLREHDFVYRRGLFLQRTIAIPYGRLQLIDVQQGILLRIFNLASLKFVTAATASNVTLPGLEKAVADQLRDRLIAVAETRRSGL